MSSALRLPTEPVLKSDDLSRISFFFKQSICPRRHAYRRKSDISWCPIVFGMLEFAFTNYLETILSNENQELRHLNLQEILSLQTKIIPREPESLRIHLRN